MEKETIGPRIKKIRETKGVSQAQLAKDLGYSHKSVITHIEKGESEMSYEKILLLLKTYLIDANELFDTSKIEKIDKLIADNKNATKNKKVVVYIHGMHGNANEIEKYNFIKNYDLKGLDYDYGNPLEVGPIIQNKFKELIKPYEEVVVIANSIGAFYTYEHLSEFNIKQAFFISPVADMSKIISKMMKVNNISLEELKEKQFIKIDDYNVLSYEYNQKYFLNPYNGNWNVPTDILYGLKDELISVNDIIYFLGHRMGILGCSLPR